MMKRVVLLIMVAAATVVLLIRPASSAGAAGCSIEAVGARHGLAITEVTSRPRAEVSTAKGIALTWFPEATVGEQRHAVTRSADFPAVDGRNTWVLRLDGMRDTPAGGPIGVQRGDLATLCAVSFFDADTGEFLMTIRDRAAR